MLACISLTSGANLLLQRSDLSFIRGPFCVRYRIDLVDGHLHLGVLGNGRLLHGIIFGRDLQILIVPCAPESQEETDGDECE